MNRPTDGKIVEFQSTAIGNPVAPCQTCGSPRETATFCAFCAFALVDIALSGSSTGPSELVVVADVRENGTPKEIQRCYGHYEICLTEAGEPWELGRGAMGITYKSLDTDLRCAVALKIINSSRFGGTDARDRFLHEARTAARLRHTNIASIFHLGVGDEDCFYAMELIEGETLEAAVGRQKMLPYRYALNIVVQSARALQIAHANQFIHRDIKPTNIMLVANESHSDGNALVKIIDFGLVKMISSDGERDAISEGYFAGTPRYASPEQLAGRAVDARSDIYSLGMCFAYMLAGAHPHPLPTAMEGGQSREAVTFPAAEATANVPGPVLALLRSMIAHEPSLRPQTADDLCRQIAKLLADGGIISGSNTQTVGAPTGFRQKRFFRRSLLCAGILAVCAVLALAFRGPFSWRDHQKPVPPPREPLVSAEAKASYEQGVEYYRKYTREDMRRAIDCVSKATELSPAYSDAHAMLANLYFEDVGRFNAPRGQLDLAVASAQRAISADPNNARAYQALGAIRNYQGRPWEALTELHHALEIAPKSAHAMCDFSLLWSVVGQPQWALPWAKGAAQTEPSKIGGWHAAAEASTDLCEDEQAEEYYRRCMEIQPVWTSAYCGLIHLYILRGDFERARQEFTKVESIQAGLLFPLTLKGQISLFSGDYADAEATYRRLLAMKRDGMVGYYGGISYLSALGFLRLRAGDLAEGQALLEEAASAHSANSEGSGDIYDLAAIRAVQNREAAAIQLLKQALDSGWKDYRSTELDPRFGSLRDKPEFQKIIAEMRSRVETARLEAKALCAKPLQLSDYPVRPSTKNGVN